MKDMTRQEWRDMVNTPYAGEVILDEDGLSEKLGEEGKTEFADFLEVEED